MFTCFSCFPCFLVFYFFMALLGSSWSSCFLLFLLVSSLFVSLFVFVCVCFNYVFVLQLIADDIEHHPCGNSAKMHWRHWHWKRRGISKRSGHRPCEIQYGHCAAKHASRSHEISQAYGKQWRIKKSFLALRQAHEFCGTVLVGR